MDDIARQDMKLLLKEAFSPGRVLLTAIALLVLWLSPLRAVFGIESWAWPLNLTAITLGLHAIAALRASIAKRFINKRYLSLWNSIQSRLKLFDDVLGRMRKSQVADLQELPKNIHRIGSSLYAALRRADMVSHEVTLTERGLYAVAPTFEAPSHDPQAKELYRIADKNIAEYKHQFAGVMAGVHRTEAQAAVFVTTVDSLRMKMIGYSLVGRSPELGSQDFLEAMQEAKMQLAAIDQALEELELTPFPKTISVLPPEAAEEEPQAMEERG